MNIFLSLSNQMQNIDEYRKYTNECFLCEKTAKAAHDYLADNYDCDVMIAEPIDRMTVRIEKAKTFKTNVYVPIRTNAAGTSFVKGCEVFYLIMDLDGRKLTAELKDAMAFLGCAVR